MIETRIFELEGTVTFYTVGDEEAIAYLKYYADTQFKFGKLDEFLFLQQIRIHDVYCHVAPQSDYVIPIFEPFMDELKDRNRWIDLDSYTEAYYLAHPETAIKVLPFSLDEAIDVVENNQWLSIFDVDTEAVIRLLRKGEDRRGREW